MLDMKVNSWQARTTHGNAPLGVVDCGWAVIGTRLTVFGGGCGHPNCYHNSLYQLDTGSLQWTELSPNNALGAPLKKKQCGMVVHTSDSEEKLCVIGGYGVLNSSPHLPAAQYTPTAKNVGVGWTNEVHVHTGGTVYVTCTCMCDVHIIIL